MLKRITDSQITIQQLEAEINSAEENSTVYLETNLTFDLREDRRFMVGNHVKRAIVVIERRDIIFDGQGNKIVFRLHQPPINDGVLFQIGQKALGTEIRNLAVDFIYSGQNTPRQVICIRNHAYGAKVSHCKLSMTSESQINLTVIQNDRLIETVFDREGDNFVVEGSDLRIRCEPREITLPIYCCGIYNDLPNSINIAGNYIYVMADGNGEKQQSVGIYNNGRFVRITDNNIKANGFHMEGSSLDHPHVVGVLNEGDYLLFGTNNCLAEWGGKAVGLENRGSFCSYCGNKLIATHTVYGISVYNAGEENNFVGNIITSTSRNPRLIVNTGNGVGFQSNVLRAFYFVPDCGSGCGMLFENCNDCAAINNRIYGVKNCGIMQMESDVTLSQNVIEEQKQDWAFSSIATEQDSEIVKALSEAKIVSE